MTVVLLLHIVTVTLSVLGCGYILFKNARDPRHLFFAITGLASSGWTLCLFLILTNISRTEIVGRLSFSFAGLFAIAFLTFVMLFPSAVRQWKRWKIALLALGASLVLLPFWPSFLHNVQVVRGSILSDWDKVSYPIWSTLLLVTLLAPFAAMLIRRGRANGVDRLRIDQVFVGFLFMLIPQFTTNLILPIVFNNYQWNNLGPVFTVLMLPFMANAILKYRLLDIRWIVSKSLIFSGIIAFIAWVLMAISYLLARIITPQGAFVVGTILIAILILPMSRAIEKWINGIFNRGGYDPDVLMNEVFAVARSELDVQMIGEKMIARLMEAFGAHSGAFAAFAPRTTRIIATKLHGFDGDFESAIPSVIALMKKHPNELIESAELEWNLTYGDEAKRHPEDKQILRAMQKAKVDLLIPLVMEGKLTAFFALGERKFDRVLRQSDVNFLNLLRAGIAPAVENAEKFAEMQELYARLQESDTIKSQFIDTISHQFRTPLASIRWNTETLVESEGLSKEDLGMVHEVQTNTAFLIHTLTLFADVIQFESESVLVEKAMIPSTELQTLFMKRDAEAKEKNVKLTMDIKPVTIVADKKYLERALDEVLENAVEYTPAGGSVSVRVFPNDGKANIEVTDTGIGMSDIDVKKRAFTKFYRAKNAILEHPDGIGLGLYLVKLVTNKLGGNASISSVLGKGTTVSIVLPASKPFTITKPLAKKPAKTKRKPRV